MRAATSSGSPKGWGRSSDINESVRRSSPPSVRPSWTLMSNGKRRKGFLCVRPSLAPSELLDDTPDEADEERKRKVKIMSDDDRCGDKPPNLSCKRSLQRI